MTRHWFIALAVPAVIGMAAPAAAQSPAAAVPIVAVTGCLTEARPGTWTLNAATEPTPSVANGPAAGQAISGPTSGKNQFSLIGISEFDLPAHKGHTVLVKGLLVKAAPMSRVNVTSVTMVAATCPAPPK